MMCMVSYQLKETDHLCQVQKKLMEMNWIKQTVNFSLQLEGSELHLPDIEQLYTVSHAINLHTHETCMHVAVSLARVSHINYSKYVW